MVLQRSKRFVFTIPFYSNRFFSIWFALTNKHIFIGIDFVSISGWWLYDERTCQELEEAYEQKEKECTIFVAGNLYTVNFDQMLQKHRTDASRTRKVKRNEQHFHLWISANYCLFVANTKFFNQINPFVSFCLILAGDLPTVSKKGVAGLRLWWVFMDRVLILFALMDCGLVNLNEFFAALKRMKPNSNRIIMKFFFCFQNISRGQAIFATLSTKHWNLVDIFLELNNPRKQPYVLECLSNFVIITFWIFIKKNKFFTIVNIHWILDEITQKFIIWRHFDTLSNWM